jgi:hypothetical protein
MKVLTVVTLAAMFCRAPGLLPGRYDKANIIPKTDLAYPTLADFRAKMQERTEERKEIRLEFNDWVKIKSPAAAKLFPNLRFAAVRWGMERHPEYKGINLSLAGGETVVAIDTKTNRIVSVGDFEKLFTDHNVTLRDAKQAKLIWNAYCDLSGRYGGYPIRQISDTEWRLGVASFERTRSVVDGIRTLATEIYYMRVLVDPKTGLITSVEHKVDMSNERKVPAN